MASPTIGRTACPECGFAAAHVRQSERCLYRYCPECGSQHHARSERQRADLLAKTRLADAAPAPGPTPTGSPSTTPEPTTADPGPAPTPTPPTPTPPKRRGLFA